MAPAEGTVPAKRPSDESHHDQGSPPSKRPALGGDDPSTSSPPRPSGPTMSQDQLAKVSQIISKEFSTEILLKHNELRLIDTEIAKCQIALEQLRRAKLIPYPSQTMRTEDMINVSSGTGPALIPEGMRYPPTHPAPWGVTDGPYTRRYSSWLIPAPEFDGGPRYTESRRPGSSRDGVFDRRVRGQQDDAIATSGRSRTQRGSHNARLQALPLGYPQPKGTRGPLTLKRQSDGKWVKLVCQNCNREDFSSVQGFINHCRISHQVHFVTHEDAAQRAGTEEGVDQSTGEVSGFTGSGQAGPIVGASVPTNTVSAAGGFAGVSDLVHKYNRHGISPQRLFPPASEDPPSTPSSFTRQREKSRRDSNMGPPVSPAFVPSSLTPHLSSLYAKTGRAGNLDALVKEARTKEDLSGIVPPVSPDALEHESPTLAPIVSTKHQRQGGLSASSSTFPTGRKGPGRMATQANSSTHLRAPHAENAMTSPSKKPTSPTNVSPSTAAVDTNQAPSLVSDDGQSGSDGEDDDERAGNIHQNEPRALFSSFDGDEELLPHETPEGSSTMEVEEKIRDWKQKGQPRPSDDRSGPEMRT